MTVPRSEFKALKAVIMEEMDAMERALEGQGLPEPYLREAKPHAMDDPMFLPSHELYHSNSKLVASLDMMRAMVQDPGQRIITDSLAHWTSAAIALVCKVKVADHLATAGPRGMPVEELSRRTGVHCSKLTKTMRFLANSYHFTEVEEGVFSNNRSSILLKSDHPIYPMIRWEGFFSLGYASHVADTWSDPELSSSEEPLDAAASKAFDFKGKGCSEVWDWGAKYEPEMIQEFGKAMSGAGSTLVNGVLADYDWNQLGKDATVVDVGGGEGGMLMPLLRAYPHLKGVLQDRKEIVPFAKLNFEKNLPNAIKNGRVAFDSADFFQPQRREGQEVYLLRWIVHDLPDHRILPVLQNQVKAMGPASKLIIIDCIIQPAVSEEEVRKADIQVKGFRPAPYPLPQSMGRAWDYSLRNDLEMSGALNALERTATQFVNLLDQAGLRMTQIIQPRANIGIVEAMLK